MNITHIQLRDPIIYMCDKYLDPLSYRNLYITCKDINATINCIYENQKKKYQIIANNKPIFLFFYQYQCRYCTAFMKEWIKLTEDLELRLRIQFVLHKFGRDNNRYYRLHSSYKHIATHTPLFILHRRNNLEDRIVFDSYKKSQRKYNVIRKWILKNWETFI